MKAIVFVGALLAVTAAGLFAWRATLPQETWLFMVLGTQDCLASGNLAPGGDPTQRRTLLRSSLLQAIPAGLPTEGDDWPRNYLLSLQVEISRESRRWRWGWPPLEAKVPVQSCDFINLYYRAGPSPGWQAWDIPPYGQEALSKDQAVERLLDLMESALEDRLAQR
jgi:hypothetical protein